jgi:chromosome partitioning protein
LRADTVSSHRDLVAKVDYLRSTADYIILDGPPRLAEMSRAIIALSDLCLVPVGASAAEVWATSDLLTLIDDARKVRKVDARLVWTRFRSYTRIAQELSEEADKALKLPALKAVLGYRVAYAEALGQGRTAAEMGDPEARSEVVGLVAEVRRIMR